MKEREHRFAFIPHLKEVGIPACGRKVRFEKFVASLPGIEKEILKRKMRNKRS
jgi:hypothetical protein